MGEAGERHPRIALQQRREARRPGPQGRRPPVGQHEPDLHLSRMIGHRTPPLPQIDGADPMRQT
jgi:hypothetical protein